MQVKMWKTNIQHVTSTRKKNVITWRREIERYIFPQVHRVPPEGAFETNLHGHLIHSKLAVKKLHGC